MSSTANRVIKNTGYLYAKMAITMFVSLYTTRLILHSLGASDFGIYNIVGGAIAMLGFLNATMASATQRFMSFAEGEGDKEKQRYIFNISVVLHLFVALLVVSVLLIVGLFFFNGILNIPIERVTAAKVVYGCLIVSTAFTVMNVPYDAVMNAHENMRYYAIIGVFESFLKLSVAFACIYTSQDKLIVYGLFMACIPLITLSVMKVYCHKHYAECVIKPRFYWNKTMMRKMTSFAGWSFFPSMFSIVSQYGLGLVLNHFWGTLLNTAQGIANQISGQLMAFSNTMLKALNPVITKSKGAGDDNLMFKASLFGCKYSYLILAFFSIPCIVEMPYILRIWLGTTPDWAVLFAQLQLLRSILEQLTITLGSVISANGEIKNYSLYKSILSVFPIFLTYIVFLYDFPPYSMYIIWILCGGVIGGILGLYYAKKLCNMSISLFIKNVLIPCMLISLTMSIGGLIVNNIFSPSLLRVFITTSTTSLLMIVTSSIISTREERILFLSLVCKIKRKRNSHKP